MNYPNKINKTYKKTISYANRGMDLENLINQINEFYLENNIAVIYKKPTIPEEVAKYKPPVDYDTLLGDVNLTKLNMIFRETLKRREDKVDPIRSTFGNIEKEEIDLDAKTEYIKQYIWREKRVGFTELLEQSESKMEVIVTFLVVLELIKIGLIEIRQEKLFDDILIDVIKDVSEEEFLGAQIGDENEQREEGSGN